MERERVAMERERVAMERERVAPQLFLAISFLRCVY
jgi:hypothetical protein